ncbi:hypothetical protein EMEDMD4_70084 [Sinorhizobium medicae]|uniref:Uncharacterized protein n=1 Tax=Sinorhizobium medicae TaxID=110321 RepID=A0A508X747_9HYPH|nr:hypothetical protein EMEDMD4_70084 [Sinorhizobium medicae]
MYGRPLIGHHTKLEHYFTEATGASACTERSAAQCCNPERNRDLDFAPSGRCTEAPASRRLGPGLRFTTC